MRSCTSPAGRLKSHQRGFWIETLVLCPGDLLSKSSNFFQKKVVGGQSPVNDRRVGGKHNTVKQADSGLGEWMLRNFQGESLKPIYLAFCQASFRMTLSRVGFLTLAPDSIGQYASSSKSLKAQMSLLRKPSLKSSATYMTLHTFS